MVITFKKICLLKNTCKNNFTKGYPCSFETLVVISPFKRWYINTHLLHTNRLDESGINFDIGFPLVDNVNYLRSFVATGKTVLAAILALNSGIACNTEEGSHHVNYDSGAGYCVFKDVSICCSLFTLDKRIANRISLVDLDGSLRKWKLRNVQVNTLSMYFTF